MSVQFGRWNFDGRPVAPELLEKVSAILAPHGPDSDERYSKDGVTILYRAFYTTKESYLEEQPHILPSGAVITWDGRLDNRNEMMSDLGDSLMANSTDIAIVAAAYEKWGGQCLAKLTGDWALAIWNPADQTVLLAKDPVGTHYLFYTVDDDHVAWSTILNPLVLYAGKTFELCEEYIAGWFSVVFPAAHLTPYVGIHAVPPSTSVLLRRGKHGVKHIVSKYWDFDPGKKIRYRTDSEYEEHFRSVFAQAVQRRLRSDRPVLAELSGGMDSSSIVCMADLLLGQAQGNAALRCSASATLPPNITTMSGLTPRLDTISWYDDSEPATDELPYVTRVEERRGRTGFHIDLRELNAKETHLCGAFGVEYDDDRFAVTPFHRHLSEFAHLYEGHKRSQGHRVVLSGIAGDDIMAGVVPTPNPELQNLLARARFASLARQLNVWAAKMRKRRLTLLWEALREFLFATPLFVIDNARIRSSFDRGFVRRNDLTLRGFSSRVELLGPLPSFQINMAALSRVRNVVASFLPRQDLQGEIRYPYLDRDLMEFMYAIPREQVVGVGKRRFLMKRALVGIDPDEILSRRQQPLTLSVKTSEDLTEWGRLMETGRPMIGIKIGIIDADLFSKSVLKAQAERATIREFDRIFMLEAWLRHLTMLKLPIELLSVQHGKHRLPSEARQIHASPQPKSSAS